MKKFDKPIHVSIPEISSPQEFARKLTPAWESRILTCNGPLVQKLEKEINKKLNVPFTIAVTSGTIALQMAIRALQLKGEIITTPFTWIATISAIRWEGCHPVFVDIDAKTLNIDIHKIEAAITPRTTAIMPVHIFGNPCDIDSIESLAGKHNLKVIYDADHAFGVNYKGSSVMTYGNVSCTSFNATKIFNTGEGGACFTIDSLLFEKLKRLRFFGHTDQKVLMEEGFNGKMSELHAALGLANLPLVENSIPMRKKITEIYKSILGKSELIRFQCIDPLNYNYSYFPLIFSKPELMTRVLNKLNEANVFPRRYFFPSLNTLDFIKSTSSMPLAEDISSKIFCLPVHSELSMDNVEKMSHLILKVLESSESKGGF